MLCLFFITNDPDVALVAEKYGVDRIWIDLETLGKAERQKNMDTVKSSHSISDISIIKPKLSKSKLLVRVNPWNERSEKEIDAVIDAGADVIMLPMWKSSEETAKFLDCVNGRAKTSLLLETKEAVECIDTVLGQGADEIHIGLNDLHLSYGMKFMFEPLANGLVDGLCEKFRRKGIKYGFGGIARLGMGDIPAEMIVREHYRLKSTGAILSRSFCDVHSVSGIGEVEMLFEKNMKSLRDFEHKCELLSEDCLKRNHSEIIRLVNRITGGGIAENE